MKDKKESKPILPFLYKEKFYKIWVECVKNGFTTNDARDYAQLELVGRKFHNQS